MGVVLFKKAVGPGFGRQQVDKASPDLGRLAGCSTGRQMGRHKRSSGRAFIENNVENALGAAVLIDLRVALPAQSVRHPEKRLHCGRLKALKLGRIRQPQFRRCLPALADSFWNQFPTR